jgi:hypothetical protein
MDRIEFLRMLQASPGDAPVKRLFEAALTGACSGSREPARAAEYAVDVCVALLNMGEEALREDNH